MDVKSMLNAKLKRVAKMFAAFGCLTFIVITISLARFCSFDEEFTKQYNQQKEHEAIEKQHIDRLPVITGVIVSDSVVLTPFNDAEAALCFFRVSFEDFYTKTSGTRCKRRSSSKTHYKWVYDNEMPVVTNAGAKLKIKDKLYNIDFSDAWLIKLKSRNFKQTLSTGQSEEEIKKVATPLQINQLEKYRNQHSLIDCYFKVHKEKRQGKNCYALYNIAVQQVAFQNGDTISFRGTVHKDKIIPVY